MRNLARVFGLTIVILLETGMHGAVVQDSRYMERNINILRVYRQRANIFVG